MDLGEQAPMLAVTKLLKDVNKFAPNLHTWPLAKESFVTPESKSFLLLLKPCLTVMTEEPVTADKTILCKRIS